MALILGAGLAGLSLARGLVEAGLREPITLVDRRTEHGDDRTWCFWQADPMPRWAGEPHHAWHRWRFIGRDGRTVEQTSRAHPYLLVRGEDFYRASLGALAAAPTVDLRLGVRVLGAARASGDAEVVVSTSDGDLAAGRVFDAMGGLGPLDDGQGPGGIELRQSFLGLEIEVDRPVFDPAVATLMDFRCGPEPADGGLHFVYVLPTSSTRALVEHTTLGPRTVPAATRRRAIAAYLDEHWGVGPDAVATVREERGSLPMTTRAFPASREPGVQAVGAAAGAIRPSSGYAFVRTQRHAEAVARHVAAREDLAAPGRPSPAWSSRAPSVGSPRRDVLDQLFLRALAIDPPGFDTTFMALARGTGADAFARFMSDASSARDEATIMRALLRPGFLVGMAASSLLRPIAR